MEKITKNGKRIAEIRHYFCNDNNRRFAHEIKADETYLSRICNGSSNAGIELLEKILTTYPSINKVWLFTGEGDMLNNGQHGGIVTSVNMQNSTNSGTINNGQQGGIVISADVWEVIQQQSASLAKKDSQIDRLIDLMERQAVKE